MNYFSLSKDGKALYCLLLTGLLLSFSSSFARNPKRQSPSISQQHQVQGTVTDGSTPLPGVTITVKNNAALIAITNYNGHYAIPTAPNDTLVVSFMGYKKRTIPIAGQTTIDIVLKSDVTTLQEVRVNAGYYSVKESERTGSISRLTAKDIEKQPVTNVLAAMQGRMAGISVIQNSGMPGGGFQIKIRGQNSLRSDGNNPMYIIDGVPFSTQSIGSSYTSTNMPAQNSPLNNINPDDIQSIEVLKDADATAIYGSRGANGVVLITTKKGKQGKTAFSANYTGGLGRVSGHMNLMDTPTYLAMRKEAFANDGVTKYPTNAYDVNGTWDQNSYTDWQKEILGGTAEYNMAQLSISGGSAQTQYLISGSYNRETTVFPMEFKSARAGTRANFNHTSQDQKFKISFASGYTYQDSDLPSTDLARDAQTLAPNAPALFNPDGSLNWENGTFSNPLAKLLRTIESKTNDLMTNGVISYNFTPSFLAKVNLGFTDLRQSQITLLPSTAFNPSLGRGSEFSSVYYNTLDRTSWILEPQLGWNKSFEKVQLDALIGTTFQQQSGEQTVSYGENFPNNSLLENPASASIYRILESNQSVYKYQATFFRINAKWHEKYILNITGRRDGSSRFGPDKQFATFGAVGAAWLFSKEAFMQKMGFLSFGKLRASWGTTGNDQIGDYQYIDTYTVSSNTYQGVKGLSPSRLFNPEFSWESNTKLEGAIELGFLNDRISTSLSLYRNRSSNQLVGIPLPGTTGFTQLTANLDAEVQNSGIELTLNTQNIISKNFRWTSSFNITKAKNELLSFPGLAGSPYANQYVIGQPLNIIKVYQNTGVDPQTGNYTFTDFNKDGNFSAVDDKKIIKDLNPQFYGGFQNTLTYKAITLDFLFDFVRQENFNEMYRFTMPGTMSNQPTRVADHWQQTGDTSFIQGYSNSNNLRSTAYTRFVQSDAAIGDASFIRLRNISLYYDVPKHWTKSFTCKVGLQGQNLLTFTHYKGIDPEFTSTGYLPPLKIFTSSLQIAF
ncbi:SusC/RagA family TonB-linked outer membrane protein [Flavobacterium aquiphilum]|uniref:SusC/RagA family TonB-linked outer membrane protein n=1 Tax=Flavobacterium aquiphilum TaxID=3003261 RepID=UPI0024801AE4|nr:SusC/RagA family TonB-linked outer membrane protein [Flavobacterium aquiphilum]